MSAASAGPLQPRKALGLGVHRQPVATPARRPHPHPSQLPPAVGGETRGREGQCWAGQATRALHRSPAPLPPGAASGRTKSAPRSTLHGQGGQTGAADLPPPRHHRLPPCPAAPGVQEEAARARGGGRAKGRGRARKGAGRAALPEDPAGFRLRLGLSLVSVRSLGSGGAACQPSWPASPSVPIRQPGEGRPPRLPPGLGPPVGGHPGACPWGWKRK